MEDIVNVSNSKLLYNKLKERLKKNHILGNYPSYLEVNYKLGVVILTQFPENDAIPYPFFMNLEAITHSFSR